MPVDQNEIMSKLVNMQKELHSLNDLLSQMRYDEFKVMVSTYMIDFFHESGIEKMNNEAQRMSGTSTCELLGPCLDKLKGGIYSAMKHYMEDDIPRARQELTALEGVMCNIDAPCQDGQCARIAQDLLRETRLMMDLTERMKDGLGSIPQAEIGAVDIAAEDIAAALDPLSYPVRIKILRMLSLRETPFSEMSSALDMRTGHLQHHLKPLYAAGYIDKSVGRGKYIITNKGLKALHGVNHLVLSLGNN
ncbi:MAG TPA: winged helix-turn-helix domain-containing protein [Methanomassiliicoccales archaeon]|nr:winged helix-turn-helix domain-containing protein [Methanomassiliicoccales archaeon]